MLQPDALTAARCTTKDVVCICLGLAGVDGAEDRERVTAAVQRWLPAYSSTRCRVRTRLASCLLALLALGLQRACPYFSLNVRRQAHVFADNDAHLTLRYHCPENFGCALIAGTGACSHVTKHARNSVLLKFVSHCRCPNELAVSRNVILTLMGCLRSTRIHSSGLRTRMLDGEGRRVGSHVSGQWERL